MRVLVACEYSGVVRDAFTKLGHDAWSCDLLDTEREGKHIIGDVRKILSVNWDLMIAHPPCTFLSVSGLHWNKKDKVRAEKTELALQFVQILLDAPIKKIALENPISCISTRISKPDQIIQPYEFGEDASKRTCLWLKNLPKLELGERFSGRLVEWPIGSGIMVERWGNQTDSGQNKLTPSVDRWKERSRTYQGIANAMAEQWSQ
jgi:site-specific DNA-cytosine methylase